MATCSVFLLLTLHLVMSFNNKLNSVIAVMAQMIWYHNVYSRMQFVTILLQVCGM